MERKSDGEEGLLERGGSAEERTQMVSAREKIPPTVGV